jgi:germination protein M
MRNKWFLGLCILLLAVFAISCSAIDDLLNGNGNGETPEPPNGGEETPPVRMRLTTFYYPDEDGNFIVPYTREIPWAEGIARATLEHMVAGELSRKFLAGTGLKAPFPAGTLIRGLTIKDGLARVDFSREFLDYPREEERLVMTALLYTLTEFSTVDRVELQVEGEKLKYLPGGTVIGEVLSRDRGINLEVADGLNDLRRVNRLVLYFNTRLGQDQRHCFVPVTRIVAETEDLARATLTELLKGPRQGVLLYSTIPAGVKLLDLSVKGGIATVNLSGELLNYRGGLEAAEHLLAQLVFTLTELPDVQQVRVFVAGRAETLEGTIPLNEGHQRPAAINVKP